MKIDQLIYLDHQATTPVDKRVVEAMVPYLRESFGNPHSGDHAVGWQAAQATARAADAVGCLIGADRDEIVFTSGATEANNLALLGLGRRAAGSRRRRILVSAIEHKCVLAAARALQKQLDYRVDVLPVDKSGKILIQALEEKLGEDVLVVSIMAVNNEIGTVQDVRQLSAVVRRSGALFHCDAAQAPCAMELQDIGHLVDLLSLSAHKMHGPQGIGALYIRRDLHDRLEPVFYGGGQQQGLRSGTVPVALCVGMGAAAALAGAESAAACRETVRQRRDNFVGKLLSLSWPIKLNGPEPNCRHPGNANILFCGFPAHAILGALQPHLAASTGAACTSGIPEPSHVLRAIGLSGDAADASIRFSLGPDTSDEDVDRAVRLIDAALARTASLDGAARPADVRLPDPIAAGTETTAAPVPGSDVQETDTGSR